jgi:hypothetical protein
MTFPIFVIQSWKSERWVTFYVNSYEPDALEVFEDLKLVAPQVDPHKLFRLVRFDVSDYDFLSTHLRDMQVIELIESAGQAGVQNL